MSFEEKSTWIYLVVVLVVPAIYFASILGQVEDTPVAEIAYVRAMITAIVIAIVASIVAHILVAIGSPKDADKRDERDRNINRFGEYVGGIVLAVGAIGVLGLTMAEFDHFWIANALYAAFVLQGLTSTTVKIVAYRRGFQQW
jgi:predicted permease